MGGEHIRSEKKRWRRYCETWQRDRSDESKKAQKNQRTDGNHANNLDEASDSLVGALNLADDDNYPNIRKLLEIGSLPPTRSTEAE